MKYVQIFNQRNNNRFLLSESQVPIPAGLFMWQSLSTRVFETRTATGREYFAC